MVSPVRGGGGTRATLLRVGRPSPGPRRVMRVPRHACPMDRGGDLVFFNTSIGRVKERNLRHDPRVCLSHADPDDPYDRVQIRGRAVRFVEGPQAERDMDELTRTYRGAERYPWRLPGERRVTVLIEPSRVRRVVGVEPFLPGALPAPPGT
ncbi:pyridoxamine 5'-phosphate oxidase family protein [Streptomyces sp. NPDC059863]|uniref:pyridoxamine 5'-phosphate oxidase family protein n=1 Tax=unclassified Streptomyces TaxID=2593676 RepID=UPI00365DC5CF